MKRFRRKMVGRRRRRMRGRGNRRIREGKEVWRTRGQIDHTYYFYNLVICDQYFCVKPADKYKLNHLSI